MTDHKSEADYIAHTHNTARFFTEHRQVSLILLVAVCVWGWYGFTHMPKRKDPSIPVRVAVASIAWPGATAQEVEQLVSRPVEQIMAQNAFIKPPSASDFGIRSISFPGLSLVYVQLDDTVNDPKKQFSDINLKLIALNSRLPQGAGPIQFNSDFGDTAALMLTVASPKASEVDIALRARAIRSTIEATRAAREPARVAAAAGQHCVCFSALRFPVVGPRLFCFRSCRPGGRRSMSPIRTSLKAAASSAPMSALL